jgi:hypothetical protein
MEKIIGKEKNERIKERMVKGRRIVFSNRRVFKFCDTETS